MTRFRFLIYSSKQDRPEVVEVRGESEAMAWERVLTARPDAIPVETTTRPPNLSPMRA